MAKKAGVASKTISRLERGVGKPSLKSVRKIADALQVAVEQIQIQQWSEEEDYWKDLHLPPELKETAEDTAEAERQSLPDEDEAEKQRIEAEVDEIIIEDRHADRLGPPSLQSKEEPDPELKPKVVETTQTAPVQIARVEANESVKPEDNEGEVELGKVGMASATLVPIGLLSTMSTKNVLILTLVLVCVAVVVYLLFRSQPRKEAAKPCEPQTVKEYLDEY